MKLYCTPGGTWAGTEKAWKDAVKAEGLDYKKIDRRIIDVPTSKAELMEFLTFHAVNPIGGSPAATVVVAPEQVSSDVPAPPPAVSAPTVSNIDELWKATPRAKRAELAVGLIDEMEFALRGR